MQEGAAASSLVKALITLQPMTTLHSSGDYMTEVTKRWNQKGKRGLVGANHGQGRCDYKGALLMGHVRRVLPNLYPVKLCTSLLCPPSSTL